VKGESLVSSQSTEAEVPGVKRLPMLTLAALVVGSMVGAGVFSLPGTFGQATGAFGALIAWGIAGFGMLMLALVFQSLAVRRPHLDAGVYAYAKAGFGELPGFLSAFGYWASACVGNVSYWVLVKSTLGQVIPAFGEGNTVLAVAVSSLGVWLFLWLIAGGVQGAATINRIVTVAKLIPIVVFIGICAFAFDAGVFSGNWWGGEAAGGADLFAQVRATMLVTVFVFLGVEGASVYSRYAKKREDVGRATVLGFVSVLALFMSVTLLSYGILPRADLAELRQPSMAGVLESVVGAWGAAFISVGLLISVMGAYLAWTLMAAEVLFVAAKDNDMPRFLRRSNHSGTPIAAALLTSLLVQIVLVTTLFSDDAFTFTLSLTSALSLIPYLLAAAYALKMAVLGETYEGQSRARRTGLLVAALATTYTAFLIIAAGVTFVLLSCIIYAIGLSLFVMTRREQNSRIFTIPELVLSLVIVCGGVAGVVGLAAGVVTI
jgi:arginine:ornithine antiporter / lysine permease